MAIYIYSEDQESCKYTDRTYTSPNDYPSTQYASLGVVQNARNGSGQPIYVTYAESLEWSRMDNVENDKNSDGSGHARDQTGHREDEYDKPFVMNNWDQSASKGVNSSHGPKGGHSYNDFMTGSARMRNCENGVVDQSIYSSRAYNSGRLWAHNAPGDGIGTENVSAV